MKSIPNSVQKQIDKITGYAFFRQFCKLPFVEEIWLFGSRARGDHQDRSDIDLAFVTNALYTDGDWSKIFEVIEEADTLLKIDDTHFDGTLNKQFTTEILKDKVVLFQRGHTHD